MLCLIGESPERNYELTVTQTTWLTRSQDGD